MEFTTPLGLVAGLVVLVIGANTLVKGATGIAQRVGISSLVIGLTVVAYGTSTPELAVSVAGAAGGSPSIALGNVFGSNVANVLFILGISALIGAMRVDRRLIRIEVPIMVGLAFFVFLLSLDGGISRIEGVMLALLAIAYTVFTIRTAKTDPEEQTIVDRQTRDESATPPSIVTSVVFSLLGLGALVVGSQLLLNSATSIARALGLSEIIIGLTIVAVGTSLPELATSIAAAIKGDRDLAVGNVIGSNIFNMTFVLGSSGLAASGGLPVPDSVLNFDLPVMLAVCFACLPIFFTGHVIMRWEGMVFVGYYVAYVAYLVLNATSHEHAELMEAAMTGFVLPLTVMTLVVLFLRETRARSDNSSRSKPHISA